MHALSLRILFAIGPLLLTTVAAAQDTPPKNTERDIFSRPAATDAAKAKRVRAAKTVAVTGRVVTPDGEPVAGAAVTAHSHQRSWQTTTDSKGQFSFDLPIDARFTLTLFASASGDRAACSPRDIGPRIVGGEKALVLKPAKRITARVTDEDGQPIAGARVGAYADFRCLTDQVTDNEGVATLLLPQDVKPEALFAEKQGIGFDYRVISTRRLRGAPPKWFEQGEVTFQLGNAGPVTVDLVDGLGESVRDLPLYAWLMKKPDEPDNFNNSGAIRVLSATTDENGRAVFPTIPRWQHHELILWEDQSRGRTSGFIRRRVNVPTSNIGGEPVTGTLLRPVPVRGVALNEAGEPISGVTVQARGAGYETDNFQGSAYSDSKGRFQVRAYPNELLMLVAGNKEWAAPAIDGLITKPGKPIEGLEFRLRPATRVFGRVVETNADGSEKLIASSRVTLVQSGRSLDEAGGKLPLPAKHSGRNRYIASNFWRYEKTDEQGHFEFFIGPGDYTLRGSSQTEPIEFTVTDQTELEYTLRSKGPEKSGVALRVVTGNPPRPVAGALITGRYRGGWDFRPATTNKNGVFRGERRRQPGILQAISPDKKLRGVGELAADASELTITLTPTASASGRLVDHVFGEPMRGESIACGMRIYHSEREGSGWNTMEQREATTDAEGRFRIDGLTPGAEYHFSLIARHPDGSLRSRPNLLTRTPKPGEAIELGDVSTKPRRSVAELIERTLRRKLAATEHFHRYQKSYVVREQNWPLVIAIVDENEAAASQWFRLWHVTPITRDRLGECAVVLVGSASDGASALASQHGVTLFTTQRPIVICHDPGGDHATLTGDQFTTDGKLDAQRLADFLDEHLGDRYGS